jgi:uncharacterized protein (TIGR02271 family)
MANKATPPSRSEAGEQSIPLAHEELEVSKRKVETGRVRVRKVVSEHEALIDERLAGEEIDIDRQSVNQAIDGPVEPRYEGDVLVIPVMEEVLVVRKQLMLKEEVRVRRRAVERAHRERVALRSEEAVVERVAPRSGRPGKTGPS